MKRNVFLATLVIGSVGCRGTYESVTRDELSTAASAMASESEPAMEPALDGSLSSYVAHALARSPELRASFEPPTRTRLERLGAELVAVEGVTQDEDAIAAAAAHEQGKFWPLHDQLFENRADLDEDDLVA